MVIVLGVLFAILIMLCVKISVGDQQFTRARTLEREGKCREACYFYAVAMFNGAGAFKECRAKILELWKKAGPFDYADIDGQACRIDAQGHSETLKIIMEVVTTR